MSYKFSETVSYGRIRRYAAQVAGGLDARPPLQERVAAWNAIKSEIVAERSAREAADDELLAAATRGRIEDADWDDALVRTSSRAYELAGKNAESDPYATLFGKVDAKRARSFGLAKASVVGKTVVKDGRRLEVADLGNSLDVLELATNRLVSAGAAVAAAEDALFEPRLAKKKLVRKLNELIAVTEAAILTAFPGRDDIVSAVLLPWFERRGPKKSATAEEPDPLTPELDRDGEDDDDGRAPA